MLSDLLALPCASVRVLHGGVPCLPRDSSEELKQSLVLRMLSLFRHATRPGAALSEHVNNAASGADWKFGTRQAAQQKAAASARPRAAAAAPPSSRSAKQARLYNMAFANAMCLVLLARSIAASAMVPCLSLLTLHTELLKMDAPQDQHVLNLAVLHVIQILSCAP